VAHLRPPSPRQPSPAATAGDAWAKVPARVEERVARAAEHALSAQQYVSAIDVLTGIGWLAPSHVDVWRQGRLPDLESAVNAGPGKVATAMRAFASWAEQRGLRPSETTYLARTRDHRPLRFSRSGEAALERAYRTHWVSPALSERRRERLIERASRPPDLVVIAPLHRDWACVTCGGSGGFLIMEGVGPRCLACAELDHLAYLPRGDATLTRRALAASATSAIVVRFSRTRKRYERIGVLIEEPALEQASGRTETPGEQPEGT
jgi:hypothetical protein